MPGVRVQALWGHNPMASGPIKIATKLIILAASLVTHRSSQQMRLKGPTHNVVSTAQPSELPKMANMDMDYITATFNHPTIPRNAEEPTFKLVRSVQKLLNQNATGILRGAYGNMLGMLGLTITLAAYHTLAGVDFVMPTRPLPPVIPPFALNAQVTKIM
eukprot:15365610-Ditylum_brightwellii.AAC.4